jgi:hypothetical protein
MGAGYRRHLGVTASKRLHDVLSSVEILARQVDLKKIGRLLASKVHDFLKINSLGWELDLTSHVVCCQAATHSNWIADAPTNRS